MNKDDFYIKMVSYYYATCRNCEKQITKEYESFSDAYDFGLSVEHTCKGKINDSNRT
jgi:hypothetical protein